MRLVRVSRIAPGLLLSVYAGLLVIHVPVWRSNVTLWGHAVQMAPLKPRPALNYAVALIARGDLDQGERWLLRAFALAGQSHIPPYDRHDVTRAVNANLATLAIIRAVRADRRR